MTKEEAAKKLASEFWGADEEYWNDFHLWLDEGGWQTPKNHILYLAAVILDKESEYMAIFKDYEE